MCTNHFRMKKPGSKGLNKASQQYYFMLRPLNEARAMLPNEVPRLPE